MGKQGGFLAAGTRTDFHDDAFFIVGIFGQKQQADFLFQVFQFLPVFAQFLLYHIVKGSILRGGIQQRFFFVHFFLQGGIAAVCFHQGGQFLILPHHGCIGRGVIHCFGGGHAVGKLLIAALYLA